MFSATPPFALFTHPHPHTAVWERLRDELDARIKATGHQNVYFPSLFPVSLLSREADHVAGFAKEVAVVTHHRLAVDDSTGALIPDPDAELGEPLVVRPTSEAVVWDSFRRWISSHSDLPLLINQWANVVRWELRTRPFLRTTEFLWQEGHTAHGSKVEAQEEARRMLDVYADVCEHVLAVPVVKGVKSDIERFAGADDTFTIEAMMQNGWALQSGTSHFLGQNFAKAFDVTYLDADSQRRHVCVLCGVGRVVSLRCVCVCVHLCVCVCSRLCPPRRCCGGAGGPQVGAYLRVCLVPSS